MSNTFEWELTKNDTNLHFVYNESIGVLQCNGQSEVIQPPVSGMLGVLLTHHDTPVTREDFFENDAKVRSTSSVNKGMHQLQNHALLGQHILQVGSNKRAVYSFLTEPYNTELLVVRMQEMHDMLYSKDSKTIESERHIQTIKKISSVAGAVAASAAASYVLVKHIRRK